MVWARDTGSTRLPLGEGRHGRDTTLNHTSGIVELSIPGLALLLLGGLERLLNHLQGFLLKKFSLELGMGPADVCVHSLYLAFPEGVSIMAAK